MEALGLFDPEKDREDREIELPSDVDTAKIEAKFKDGVLAIDLPRPRDLEITYTPAFTDIVHELRGHIGAARKT